MSVSYTIAERGSHWTDDWLTCDGCGHGAYRARAWVSMREEFVPWRYCPKCGQAITSFEEGDHGGR